MILIEIKKINESQKLAGLPQQYSDMELYHHAFGFLQQHPDLRNASPEIRAKGKMLLRILHNAVQQAVKHREDNRYDDDYNIIEPFTTEEDTAYMREVQGKLKLVRNALANSLGLRHRYTGGAGNRAAMSARMRELDPTGVKQRSSGFQPSDDPELRRNMPAYQPGGRFYDPNDPIHKK